MARQERATYLYHPYIIQKIKQQTKLNFIASKYNKPKAFETILEQLTVKITVSILGK